MTTTQAEVWASAFTKRSPRDKHLPFAQPTTPENSVWSRHWPGLSAECRAEALKANRPLGTRLELAPLCNGWTPFTHRPWGSH